MEIIHWHPKLVFNLGFVIDLYVIFGPCQKTNVALVTNIVKYMYFNMLLCYLKLKLYYIYESDLVFVSFKSSY
jgi:hypothetical protein